MIRILENTQSDDFVIKNGILVQYVGNDLDVVIPNTVRRIGNYAFYDCFEIKSVEIPDGVEEIGKGAFMNCESLKNVKIPDSVKKIDDTAFNRTPFGWDRWLQSKK